MANASAWGHDTTALEVCQAYSSQIKDKVILVTGPTVTGVGYGTAEAIARLSPKMLILAGRSQTKLEESQASILKEVPDARIKLLRLDLSELSHTRQAAKELLSWNMPIDVLIHNAGVMDNPYTITSEGHEIQFVTNYLGPWLFTQLVLPRVLESESKRVVLVASSGHVNGKIRWDDPAFKTGYNKKEAYGQSKTGDMLFAIHLTKLYGDQCLTAFSLDPGGISTPLQQHWSLEDKQDIARKFGAFNMDGTVNNDCGIWKDIHQGASTTCRAAFDPELGSANGSYLVDCQVANDKAAAHAKDPDSAERLWAWTNDLLSENF